MDAASPGGKLAGSVTDGHKVDASCLIGSS